MLPAAVGILVLAVGAFLVVRDADELAAAIARIGAGPILVSGVLSTIGLVLIGRVWLSLARGLGVRAPARQATGVFFVSQLGKYVPGSVWPFLLQMELGRRWGTPRRTMLSVNVLMLVVIATTGLGCGVVLLPWTSGAGLSHYWWTVLFLVPLLACLHPRTVPAVADALLARIGRERLGVRVPPRAIAEAVAWSLAVWVAMGAHLWVLTGPLGASGPRALLAAVGGMGLGWAAGLIFIPAPAGAGVRDVILVATFAAAIGGAAALTVALSSRLLLLLGDALLAGVGSVFGQVTRPSTHAPRPGGVAD